MGWFSDFISNPISTVSKTISDVGTDIGNLGTSIDQTVRDVVPGGWLGAAALGAGAYGLSEAGGLSSLFGSTTAPEIGTGLESGMATTAPVTQGTVQATDLGTLGSSQAATTPFLPSTVSQGTNIAADYGAPTAPGGLGIQATQGAGTSLVSPGSSTLGLGSPSEGYFANATGAGAADSGFLSSLMNGNVGGALGAASNWIGKNPIPAIYGAGSLYDMYAKNQMAQQQQQRFQTVQNQINGMYAPGSPEYNAMAQEMARKDAAAGRNSQYGVRATDLAAKIAGIKANMLTNTLGNQNTMFNTGLSNQYGMFNTPLTLAALTATQKGQ